MIFTPAKIEGAYLIEPEKKRDERGFFARSFCQKEFEEKGLNICWVQSNISFNEKKGTIRGMHYQTAPHEEIKLVRCTWGALYDVLIDLRPESPTFKQWETFELSEANHRILYIPKGVAHAFQTLVDKTEVFYEMSEAYHPESSKGIRWNDPFFNIKWPISNPILSSKDQNYPNFNPSLTEITFKKTLL